MKLLQDAIINKGKILSGNIIKVGSFLNQQIDVRLLNEMGKDIYSHFNTQKVTKILTVEASGIAMACLTAQYFNCDVIFAKKSKTANVEGEVLSADCFSFTHKTTNTLIVPKEYLNKNDNVLIIDDFLANGEAIGALAKIIKDSGANLVGSAIGIEKGFQGGGDKFRAQGMDVYSLAIIESIDGGKITFRS